MVACARIARNKGFLILFDNTKLRDRLKVTITETDPLNAEAKIAK